ncbi:hypothetical protein BTI_4528 [Burkholderia thailandensis MSMB121]|nr:hypothetical protein BTI_4528 [Burkholderia thailandensis MSMB121]
MHAASFVRAKSRAIRLPRFGVAACARARLRVAASGACFVLGVTKWPYWPGSPVAAGDAPIIRHALFRVVRK